MFNALSPELCTCSEPDSSSISGLRNSSIGHSTMNERTEKVFLQLPFIKPFTNCYPSLELVSKFPKTDILYEKPSSFNSCLTRSSRLTHGPAYQIFDRTGRHEDVGCEALRARLSDIRPRLHLAGHIHEAHGAHIHAWDTTAEPPSVQSGENILNENIQDPNLDHTVFVNAANWPSGERMQRDISGMVKFGGPGFRPVVVDLKE